MADDLALNKTCSQSSTLSSYVCGYAFDANYDTFNNTNAGAGEWLKVDLGAEYNIGSIYLGKRWGYGTRPSYYHIQTADDWGFTSNVVNIITENNETSDYGGGGITWDTDDFGTEVNTRYIRLLCHTNNQYVNVSNFYVYEGDEANEYIEDASLDLSVYYCNLENLQAFFRAHDGIELHDIQAALAAYNLSEEDFAGWLGAFFEDKSDLGAILETWATQYKDLATDFDAKGQSIESLTARLETAKAKYKNLAAFLSVTDGSVLKDLAALLSVTDGSALKNLGLYLKAVQSVPAFRSITAQRVSSVVHEVS